MLGSADHSGVISLLIGLVLVVLCGIGISLVAENRLTLGNSKNTISAAIKTNCGKLEKLESRIDFLEDTWNREYAPLIGQDEKVGGLRSEASRNIAKLADLRIRKSDLHQSLLRIAKDSKAYRIRYRTQTRADSVGKIFDTIARTDGRTYHDVIIRGFDASGIRIHHKGGSARIGYSELPKSLKERFHWHPSEIETPQPKRPADPPVNNLEPPTQQTSPTRKKAQQLAARKPQRGNDSAEITSARNIFIQTRRHYLDAHSQASTARYNSNDSKKSVPGSLETWAERAERLSLFSQNLRARYLKARNDLSAVSPNDSLLRQFPD